MNKVLNFLVFFGLLSVQFVLVVGSKIQYQNFTSKRQQSKDRVLYFVREPAASFVDAVKLCGADQFVLAQFKDDEDIEFLNDALSTGSMPGVAEVDYIYLGGVYIGPSQLDGTVPAFRWFESGTDVTNWGPGQPNKLLYGTDENCLVAFRYGGDWAVGDGTCTQKFPFICANIRGVSQKDYAFSN